MGDDRSDGPGHGVNDAAERLDDLADAFTRRFGRAPSSCSRAPGRANLIGEHTDYSEGLVLPCAIDLDTVVMAAPRDDARVRAVALDLDRRAEFDLNSLVREGDFADYVRAPAWALTQEGFAPRGLDLLISSRVPLGSGLSSSAALGVAVIGAWDRACGLSLSPHGRARLAHLGESRFVGVGCGILDQFASALGRPGHALHIDCRTGEVEPIPIAGAGFELLLVHSGRTRALAEAGYRERVDECADAVARARGAGIGDADARSLRDFDAAHLEALERALPERLYRRARHVITENARVGDYARALRAGDVHALGRLTDASHASLRDDFEVSTPELDALCEQAQACEAVHGARLCGAGFGGCTLNLVAEGGMDEARAALQGGFARRFGATPQVIEARVGAGARAFDWPPGRAAG